MVNKIKTLWFTIRESVAWADFAFGLWIGVMSIVFCAMIHGCSSGRGAAPKPSEPLILRPGQSAVVLEDITIFSRIPAQGNELYSGPVLIQKGAVILKPIVAGQ